MVCGTVDRTVDGRPYFSTGDWVFLTASHLWPQNNFVLLIPDLFNDSFSPKIHKNDL